jgi:hypothetical protein
MSYLMYLLPVVFIIGGLVYTLMARKNIQAQMASGNGPELFHNGFAHYFKDLLADERLVSVWMGTVYTGESSTAGAIAKGLANAVASRAIGVSSYVPTVFVGITTRGRVMVAEEFSEMGQRGNYRIVRRWDYGAIASTTPSPTGAPVKGQDGHPVILSSLNGPDGQAYHAWLHASGHELMFLTGRPVSEALPTSPEQCQARWDQSREAFRTLAASPTA